MAQNSTETFDKIQQKILQFSWWHNQTKEPDIMAEVNRMIDKTILTAHQEYQRVNGDKDALKENVRGIIMKEGNYQNIHANIAVYKKRHEAHQSQHLELKKIENAQGRRALFWRTTSTIAFASVIFFFYWLAGSLGVQLPLSRFGM